MRVFRAVDASGYARVDFLMEKATGKLVVNEINTIPGFTSISMFPKLWEATGLAYEELLGRLVELGLDRHRERASPQDRLQRDRGVLLAGRGAGRRPAPPASEPERTSAALELVYHGHTRDGPRRGCARPRDAHPDDPMAAYVAGPRAVLEGRAAAGDADPRPRAAWRRSTDAVAARRRACCARPGRRARAVRPRRGLGRCAAAITSSACTGRDAARAAVRMREDLHRVRALDPGHADALFGLGLYDYYADVLPRAAKVLRFLARIPGGDRARGLAVDRGRGRPGDAPSAPRRACQLLRDLRLLRGPAGARRWISSTRCGGCTRRTRCGP